MKLDKISIVGLGKLGATTLCVLASKGFRTLGVDISKGTVQKIKNGISPIYEPHVQELLNQNMSRIDVSSSFDKISDTDMTIIIVPTPSTNEGNFTTKYVEDAIISIGKAISKKKEYYNVVVTSTVLPGSMVEIIQPLLEKHSGKKVGENLGLCYNPDFIAIGDIVRGLLKPDMILIGESDKKAGDMVEKMHLQLMKGEYTTPCHGAPIHRMNLYNAELAKISLNAFVTMKMTFANTIGEICEKMPTGNANDVLRAIGDDSRVGYKYLKAGLSYGGPCFPRDNRAFVYVADKYHTEAILSLATDVVNKSQIYRMVDIILGELKEARVRHLSVLGLTYKPKSNLIEESASYKIVQKVINSGIKVKAYDPSLPYWNLKPQNFEGCFSIEECLKGAKVCFIGTPWEEFKELEDWQFLQPMTEKPTIIDAWGIQSDLKSIHNIKYMELGVNDK